jgi:RND superfamily putative drug exporter
MTLIPAFMTLMGEKSWYIPRWLDRALPNITIEPPHDGGRAAERSPEQSPAPAGEG